MATKPSSTLIEIIHNSDEMGVDLLNRKIVISGEITQESASDFFRKINLLEAANDTPITIEISSPGGDVDYGFAIAGRIRTSPCEIIAVGFGVVASIAVIIFASADVRKIEKYCRVMVHSVSILIEGKLHDHNTLLQESRRQEDNYAHLLEEQTGTSCEKWLELMRARTDTYFGAIDAVHFKLAQEII